MNTVHPAIHREPRGGHVLRSVPVALLCTLALLSVAVHPADAATKKSVKKAARSFTVSLRNDSQTVVAGETATYPFAFRRTGGFRGVVAFDVLDLPAGVKASVISQSTTQYEVRVATSTTSISGSSLYYLRARSGSVRRLVPFRLTVTPATTSTNTTTTTALPAPTSTGAVATGDFALIADIQPSTTRTIAPGQTAAFGIRIDRKAFSTPINFVVEGLPSGAKASFNPNPSQTNTDLTVTTTTNSPSGTYLLAITGNANGLNRAVAVRLVIRRVGQFTLTATPLTLKVNAGNDAVINATVGGVPTGAAIPNVTVDLIGAPAGVTLQVPILDASNTKFVLTTSADTAAGVYPLTLVGTSGSFSQRLTLSLTVTRETPGFGLSAQPETLTIKSGSPGSFDLKLVPINGFAGRVAFSVAGLPDSVVGTFEQTTGGATSLRLSVSPSVAPTSVPKTTYPVYITATSGQLSATIPVKVIVE
jgi:hypothetical protein